MDFKNSAVLKQIFAIVVGGLVLIAVIFFGARVELGNFAINPSPDVVEIADNAILVRQQASQRSTVLVARDKSNGLPAYSVCSEPPPDVTQDVARQIEASLNAAGEGVGQLDAGAKSDLKTASNAVFERSQGVQLLRDTMYRICEAFQNGVIESEEYSALMAQLIRTANFIIPFEQCANIAIEIRRGITSGDGDLAARVFQMCSVAALNFNGVTNVAE